MRYTKPAKSILILDTNRLQGQNLFSYLKGLGYGPIYCPTQEDAIRTMENHMATIPTFEGRPAPNTPLIELIMVDMTPCKEGQRASEISDADLRTGFASSLDTVRALKKQYPGVPIIIMSSFRGDGNPSLEARAAGAGFLMNKSSDTRNILSIIETMTSKEGPPGH